ncbi:DUF3467 domain-containing protein [Humibacter ginsenosidimutans]|uniref:DUF3467 domain-containing protein n=1 Tax=Humibacter ginsenosidimutans TaxID=2599293 RepID=A0A5B8M8Z2_9MICO|nr:DUF3467 domain-containing protein [Humibacter ginsenosidimutans]QDZ16102.1 DUF3467 domain-containing protein [Humibacter ginsenosidimutans]
MADEQDDAQQSVPTQINFDIPSENEAGTFADFASIWHTDNVFVLDFASLRGPATETHDEHGTPQRSVNARVVTRVRIPPEQVFELAKALTRELEVWEQQTGRRAPQ